VRDDTRKKEAPIDSDRGGIKPRSYPLKHGFQIIGISEVHGRKLVDLGLIKTIWLGPSTRRITEAEISRLLDEGIPEDALTALRRRASH